MTTDTAARRDARAGARDAAARADSAGARVSGAAARRLRWQRYGWIR